MLALVNQRPAGFPNYKKYIAWLEKQGEQKPDNHVQWSDEEELHIKELESLVKKVWAIAEHENDKDTIREMRDLSFFLKTLNPEKRGEQKPADEIGNYDHGKVLDSLMSAVIKTPEESLGIDSDTYNKIVDECVYGEQKPVWSKEDDNCLSTIISEFSKCAGKSVSKDEWMRCNDFLNSLKDRCLPQPKQEWSEEDKNYYDTIIAILENTKDDAQLSDSQISFLKSLRPQNRWKPSDEQLELLSEINKNYIFCGDSVRVFWELLEQLKKLREE